MSSPSPDLSLFSYDTLLDHLADSPLAHWAGPLEAQLRERLRDHNNGNLPRFLDALAHIPVFSDSRVEAEGDAVRVVPGSPLDDGELSALRSGLVALMPWRKGPFDLAGVKIDSEWQCQRKWARVAPHLSPLHGRWVLDVGSGNGYFGWRMLAAGAQEVVGVDPSWLSVVQHQAVKRLAGLTQPNHVLPLTLEAMTQGLEAFDTVCSMGVLYHRRSPLDHLEELRRALRPGGELVLETLVVPGPAGHSLVPVGRYARMNNVWFLPSVETLCLWCEKMGFTDVRCVDESVTSTDEQRTTAWKPGKSLADYLNPDDPGHTIEGHPAPRRAVIVARRPSGGGRLRRYEL